MIRKYLAPDAGGGRVARRLRIVTFTTLFPNAAAPAHGVFVANRLRYLLDSFQVAARVVAPVPWFPLRNKVFGRYARFAAAPKRETRFGVAVFHPRYIALPRIGMALAPLLLCAASLKLLRRLQAEQDFDLIDAHYAYPDGVAAVLLGRVLGKPVVITARGTDVNLIPRHALPRRWLRWAVRRAAALVTVADALQPPLIALGADPAQLRTLRNGVDLELFRPHDRKTARAAFGVAGKTLLSVGHLIERKGHDRVIGALPRLADCRLLIAGEGPERARLEALAARLGVAGRVRFLGALPHAALPRLYSAADALVLASSREGWANVLLESMACGTPVIASDAWGNPEVVAKPAAGVLMRELTAAGVAEAAGRLFRAKPSRAATRRYAEKFSWDATTAGQLALFGEILAQNVSRGGRR